MFEIDEKAVSDAVSFDRKPKEMVMAPPPAPTPTIPQPIPTVNTPATSAVSSDVGGDLPLAAIAGGLFVAFAAGTFLMRGRSDEDGSAASSPAPAAASKPKTASGPPADTGLSIPYDAAARIAYDEWRALHNKGDYDEAKFFNFRARYLAVTSDNMAAKKIAREKGTEPDLQVLSPTADQ
jgi:hypothetical protein